MKSTLKFLPVPGDPARGFVVIDSYECPDEDKLRMAYIEWMNEIDLGEFIYPASWQIREMSWLTETNANRCMSSRKAVTIGELEDLAAFLKTLPPPEIKTQSTELPPCTECGACCKAFGIYEVNSEDIERLGDKAKLTQKSHLYPEGGIMKTKNFACVALKGTKCSVYDKRPTVCRVFERGSEECRMAVKRMHFFNL